MAPFGLQRHRQKKVTHKRRYLNIWNNEIKEVIKKNKIAYRICLNMKSLQDKINYKRLMDVVKN